MEFDKNNNGEKALDEHVTELLSPEYKKLPDSFFHEDIGGVALNATAENTDTPDTESPKSE